MDFLRPALLWGLLGIGVPILLHLLGRRRVRTVPIATLRFLERARARASAHLKLRRLLLLLSRAAAVGLLALLYAGPGCRQPEGPAAPATWVLILDTSPSMAASRDGRVPLEDARRSLGALLAGAGPEDRFLLVTTREAVDDPRGHPGEGFGPASAELRRRLDGLGVAHGPHRVDRALASALALLDGVPGGRVALATDLQATAWPEGAPAPGPAVPVHLIDVGLPSPRNAWLAAVEEEGGEVRVRVGSSGAMSPGRRTVHVVLGDGRRLTAFLEGPETTFRFEAPPGVYEGEVRLEDGGDLALDDVAAFVGRARARTQVLLVNGDPWGFELADELFFVRRAFSRGGRVGEGFRVREVRLGDLVPGDVEDVDVVVLANPGPLGPEVVEALHRRLREGAGILVSAGDQWDAGGPDPGLAPLLAAPVRDVVAVPRDDPARRPFETLDLAALEGPAGAFRDPAAGDLSGVRVVRYWLPEARAGDETQVWMRLENGVPLLVERPVGAGRALFLGTTLDRDGADLCLQPAFLPWLERVLLHAAGRLRPPLAPWVPAGHGVTLPHGPPALLEGPRGRTEWRPGERYVPPEPGVYRITSAGALVDAFAVRLDPAESDLTRLTDAEVAARLGPARRVGPGEGAAAGLPSASGRRDVSGALAAALLAALLLEALLSGRWTLPRRRPAGLLGGEVGP
ncbi:MAG: BatA domain-containing protein [Deferrisomatales bacterium]